MTRVSLSKRLDQQRGYGTARITTYADTRTSIPRYAKNSTLIAWTFIKSALIGGET